MSSCTRKRKGPTMTRNKPRYTLHFYYGPAVVIEPEHYRTKAEALRAASEWVRECRQESRQPLTQVGSFRAGDAVTLKLGGRQGYHEYGRAYISDNRRATL